MDEALFAAVSRLQISDQQTRRSRSSWSLLPSPTGPTDHFSGSHHYTEIEEFQAVMLRAWSLLVGVMEFSSTERMSKRLQAAAFPPRTSAHRDEFIQCVSRMRSLAKLPWAHDEFARLMRVTGLADMLCQAAGKEDRLRIASHSSALP